MEDCKFCIFYDEEYDECYKERCIFKEQDEGAEGMSELSELIHERAEAIHKEHFDRGYQQGRADAIEEVLHKLQELKTGESCPKGCHCSSEQDKCPYNECNDDVIRIVEQLKEKND